MPHTTDLDKLRRKVKKLEEELEALHFETDPLYNLLTEVQRFLHSEICSLKCHPLCLRSRRAINLRGAQ